MSLNVAYIALGSNLGKRLEQMQSAVERLAEKPELTILHISPIYENRAIGMGDADPFLNAVAKLETSLAPEALLDVCLAVEDDLKRVRAESWIPRTIDIDLLVYEGVEIESEKLILPHPEIQARDFVARPLMDIAPDLVLRGKTIDEWVGALPLVELMLYPKQILLPKPKVL
ncbi:MAG: 2-amino-4-hydroxy-6-hydroxymethyldihydropteridine diphosphokinase [Verrucomicrobiota bacterium]